MKKLIALICLFSAMSCLAATGETAATRDNQATAPKVSTGTSTPPAEMSALYSRIGRWNVVIRTLPGRSLLKGGVDHGVMTITKGPGGFSIVQDFWSRGTSGHVLGQSYAWWDAHAKAYKSVWCDNTQGCSEFTTIISGNSWTVEMNSDVADEKVHTTIRAVMSKDHNTIHEEVTNAYNGGPAHIETISDYERVVPEARMERF
jgi:hypothetical protein